MDSVELYRQLDCGWVECGGIRLACTPEREQEVMRQVAWAKTFGLPLELLSADEARELFPLMVTDGVRCASYLPTDGYLDPSQLTYALIEGARAGRLSGVHAHARARDRRRRRPGARRADRVGRRRGRDRRQRRRDVRRRDRAAGRRARADRPVRARVPRHPAVPGPRRRRGDRPPADAARPRPARLLPRGGRRAGDGRLRAPQRPVGAGRAPRSTGSRPTSTAACSRRTGHGSRRSRGTPPSASRRWRTSR